MDNEYLNGYARIFGAVGTAIYVSLCRHADNQTQTCFPSMELISEELNISRGTISKYIKLFEKHRIIQKNSQKRDLKQKWTNNEYILLDKNEWIKNSRVQPLDTDSRVQPLSEPCANNSKSRVQPLDTKETHINYTHIKETNEILKKLNNARKELIKNKVIK